MTTDDKTETETTPAAPTTPVPTLNTEVTPLDAAIMEMRSRDLTTKQRLDAVGAEVASLVKMIRDEVIAQLDDLAATVGQHADTLDLHASTVAELATTVGRGAAPPPPTKRGDVGQRQLPQGGGVGVELHSASSALPNLETGEDGATELQIDPTKPGQHVVQLPSGGELVVNVRRPSPPRAVGVVRDGRPTGGTRRS